MKIPVLTAITESHICGKWRSSSIAREKKQQSIFVYIEIQIKILIKQIMRRAVSKKAMSTHQYVNTHK